MEKENKGFTKTDYFSASISREADLDILLQNETSILFSIYTAGVAVECLLRAYLVKQTKDFDSRHDLKELLTKSKFLLEVNDTKKGKINSAIVTLSKVWSNNLRYTSDKRMKRFIGHEMGKAKAKDVNKYLKKHNKNTIESAKFILEIGRQTWS